MIGSTISHYRILSKLGEGGMGVVYLAEDTKLQRTVALKFLSAEEVGEEERERFLLEARAAATIQHPNVCPIHAVEEEDGRLFFAMAYIKGRTIRQLLENGPLPIDRAVELALQIASGLHAAHQQGVVHRDIKSGNVIVDEHGNAIILDFGLATRASAARITRSGKRLGTPAYMSPEQIQAQDVDHRTDLWSLGVMLFEMLTGRLPFREDGSYSVLFSIVQSDAPKVSEFRAEVPKDIEQIVATALAKNPKDRWQNAGQMAAALRRLRSSLPDLDATVVMAPPPVRPRRTRLWIGLAATVTLLIAAGVAWKLYTPQSTLPAQKHLAILPFTTIGKDAELQALADGLAETITSQLSQVEQFQSEFAVVPSSEIRGRKIQSAEQARRIHGANLAISGSVQRAAKGIQLTLHLIDTSELRQVGVRTVEAGPGQSPALREAAVAAALRLVEFRSSKPAATTSWNEGTADASAQEDYLRGRGYLARMDVKGNVARAVESLESAIAKDANYALAHSALAEAYWHRANATSDRDLAVKALASAEKAVQLRPGLPLLRVKWAELLLNSGRKEEALQQLQQVQAEDSHNADVPIALGDYYTAAGNFSQAEAAYREAVRRRPIHWYAHLKLGLFFSGRGRFADARSAYQLALKLTPDNGMVLLNLASLEMRQGKYAAASELLQRSLRFDSSPRSFGGLGLALYFQGKYQQAATALESAIDLDADRYALWGNLGTVYRRLPGSGNKAEVAFRKAIELGEKELALSPGDHRVRANLAEYWAKLKEPGKSLALIEAIPTSARRPYMGRIALAYELLGQRAKAIETVRTLLADRNELGEIRDDPDFLSLWNDPAFQDAIRSSI